MGEYARPIVLHLAQPHLESLIDGWRKLAREQLTRGMMFTDDWRGCVERLKPTRAWGKGWEIDCQMSMG